MAGLKCTIPNCEDFAEGDTTPPLCSRHLDISILVDFAQARKELPTLDILQHHFLIARSASDFWSITFDNIAELLPGYLAAKKIAFPATTTENASVTTQKAVNQ